MNVRSTHRFLASVLLVVALQGCSPAAPPTPSPGASQPPTDYTALEAGLEQAINAGPASLGNVRAVLISVDGQTRVARYRDGFTETDHAHVFSVTKSVLSVLIGIAITDGLIADLDQPLSELLPKHRRAMTGDTASVTLRHLMTMSAGFQEDPVYAWTRSVEHGSNYVDTLLERRREIEPGKVFLFSDADAHLVSAVLAAALERASGGPARTVLDYAREKLFDPLGVQTRPSYSQPLPPSDWFAPGFRTAGFGWGTDPDGIPFGGYGLRLTAPDMLKIGELYASDGRWNGQQIVTADWVRQSAAPSAPEEGYGLLWWRLLDPHLVLFAARGFGGQRIDVAAQSGAVVVVLSEVSTNEHVNDADPVALENFILRALGI